MQETSMLEHDSAVEIMGQPSHRRAAAVTAFAQWADAPVAAPTEPVSPLEDRQFGAMADLLQLSKPEADPVDEPKAWPLPPPSGHITGSELRRRLITPESIAELASQQKPSLLQRLMRWKH
ncbi:hypothetical protein [Novosphingobium silvae]|nr:hypothetical protein [Novosphingobium silvae]